MKTFKSYEAFLNESFLFEAEKNKDKSKISPELDMPQRHDWVEKIIHREWDKEHGDELSKAEESGDEKKISEIKDKIKKDLKFGKEYNDYIEKNQRYDELLGKLNKAGGLKKFKKENSKEYDELLDLQANHMSPVTLSTKPGGMLQITTQDMDTMDDEAELSAEAFRKKMKDYIDKNGKPKGVLLDLRSNTGGSQETAKGITDFFVDDDKYTIENQRYAGGVRRYRDLPYPEGLEKALAYTEEKKISDYVDGLSDDEKKKYWEKSKKDGDLSIQNDRKNKVDAKYRLTGIPTVVQTSIRTFSAGEFTTDTVKNLNPNVVHIGHNTGGGSNQTFGAYEDDEWDNKDKSSIEKAKIVARAYKNAYWDEKGGQKIHDDIMKKIESGEINDKLSMKDVAKITKETAFKATGDAHIDVSEDPERPGSVFAAVPQVKSDRVVTDKKTGKPLMKDGVLQFEGNWEQKGVGAAGTSPFVESNPDTATRDALEILYDKTGQKDLAKKLKENPEEFGLSKDGKDGIFDTSSKSKQSAFVNGGDERQKKQLESSIKSAKETAKSGILDKMKAAEKAFDDQAEGKKVSVEEVGISKIYSSIDPKVAEQMKKQPVPIRRPGKKPKMVQRQTILDFVPVDTNDPEEIAMLAVQKKQYLLMQAYRIKNKLTPLEDYEVWYQKKLEMAQDNKDYRDRKKAKLRKELEKKNPAVKESHVSEFDYFLAEEECIKKFWDIAEQTEIIAD